MITASQALKQSMKGDPKRALIIADNKIKEAVSQNKQAISLAYSKHLYGWPEMRHVIGCLQSNGFFCCPAMDDPQSNNYTIKVRW